MHLQPPLFQDWTLPGKALPITADGARLGSCVMWADVYKGPERGQTNTYCDLSLKRTQRARIWSGENAGKHDPNLSISLSPLQDPHMHPQVLEIRESRSALWGEENRLICFGDLL